MGKYLDSDGLGYFWGKIKAYVQQQIQAIGAITGVKGDAESTYRTGNVNLTPANIGVGAVGLLDSISESDLPSIAASKIYDILPIANGGTGANIVTANYVFAGPDTVNGSPRFRSLAAGDIPNISASKITGALPIAHGGTGATTAADAWDALGGGDIGKKDSLAASDIPNLAASKITSGTLALARGGTASDNTARAINTVFAGPSSGSAGNASWRKLVAADIPNLNTSKLTAGTLGIARGGTGSSTVVSVLANTTRTVLAWGPLVMVQLHGATGTPSATATLNTNTLASYKPAYNVSAIVADTSGHLARLWVEADTGSIRLAAVNYTSSSAWYGTLIYLRVPS